MKRIQMAVLTGLMLLASPVFAQGTNWVRTVTIGVGTNRPIPKALQELPHGVGVNNDNDTIRPMVFHDPVTGNYFYVESDGRHITAFTPEGKILWHRNPFVDAHLEPYRFTKPIICLIGREEYPGRHKLAIGFNSSQGGTLDDKTGDFEFGGQD